MTLTLYNVSAARLLPLLRDEVMEFELLKSGRLQQLAVCIGSRPESLRSCWAARRVG